MTPKRKTHRAYLEGDGSPIAASFARTARFSVYADAYEMEPSARLDIQVTVDDDRSITVHLAPQAGTKVALWWAQSTSDQFTEVPPWPAPPH